MDAATLATTSRTLELMLESWRVMRRDATHEEEAALEGAVSALARAIERVQKADAADLVIHESLLATISTKTREAVRAGAAERPALAGLITDASSRIGAGVPIAHDELRTEDVQESYLKESRHQLRLMWSFNVVSLLLALAAPAVGVVMTRGSLDTKSTWVTVLMIVSLVGASAAAAWQGRECRRSAAENRRIGRQSAYLDAYLSPLPKSAQDLLRSVMIQRLYPRLLDDDVLLRDEEIFPTTAELMEAVLPGWDDVGAVLAEPSENEEAPSTEPTVETVTSPHEGESPQADE